jgi:hypothetical protein
MMMMMKQLFEVYMAPLVAKVVRNEFIATRERK